MVLVDPQLFLLYLHQEFLYFLSNIITKVKWSSDMSQCYRFNILVYVYFHFRVFSFRTPLNKFEFFSSGFVALFISLISSSSEALGYPNNAP